MGQATYKVFKVVTAFNAYYIAVPSQAVLPEDPSSIYRLIQLGLTASEAESLVKDLTARDEDCDDF